MTLPKYPPERRREIAAALDVDEQYVYQVCARIKTASPALARRLHDLDTDALLWDLRPDDWHLIWPELIGTEGAPVVPGAEQPDPDGEGPASPLAMGANVRPERDTVQG